MTDREKVIEGFELFIKGFELFIKETPSVCTGEGAELDMFRNVLELLKEQDRLLHKKQKDIDRLCNEISELKHKFHDKSLKEQEGLLGIHQTADSITFVSTGTAQQGESRGLLLGKLAMHEWLKKELLYRGLLTDEIRAVFDEAKLQEGR